MSTPWLLAGDVQQMTSSEPIHCEAISRTLRTMSETVIWTAEKVTED